MPHRLSELLRGDAPWLMGVVNVTPDSFSDGGAFLDPAAAIAQARRLHAEGAHLLDVGGESTGPGTQPIMIEAELARIEPVVAALAAEIPLSIDTYHARPAARCLELGARVINDVSAGRGDSAMASVIREHACVFVMMYAKDGPLPHATDQVVHYRDLVGEVGDWLLARVDWALSAGLDADSLVLDPGMSRFLSHDPNDSWRLLEGLEGLVRRLAPLPLMIGTSRKGFLGGELAGRDPLSQFTGTIAASRGAAILRTHEVGMAKAFLDAARQMGMRFPAADGMDVEHRLTPEVAPEAPRR